MSKAEHKEISTSKRFDARRFRSSLRKQAQAINERNRVPGGPHYKEPSAIDQLRAKGFGVVESEGRAVIVTGPQIRFPKELMSDRLEKDTVAVRFDTPEIALKTLRDHERALAEDSFARIERSIR